MALTIEQLQTLKADIAADQVLSAYPNNSDGAFEIAKAYNTAASPAWVVWKKDVSTYLIRNVLVWTEYESLSATKQNAFTFLCSNGIVDATLANVRAGIAQIFAGPQQAGNLTALTNVAKRNATRLEKIFSTGTGSAASPATVAVNVDGSPLSLQDVETARNLP